ncbi:hypothetical protein EPIR_1768 [Erwinia piriflorinigrans CFBP 5888]|uniref:Uncharacterized protein n=1 Tax=Erwinia piriflorinigrans CFBP 5888 TaxID=1161919 RepID=V5Z864_9GAMM|nr:hypothetical protein EPIR_1768 [Erwinia piriflorinigrans CFBP 5888]
MALILSIYLILIIKLNSTHVRYWINRAKPLATTTLSRAKKGQFIGKTNN